MTEAVDFWSNTITAYAGLQLESPELTPKLLQRPPFRFIHDVVSAINKRFNAYTHVFPPDMADSANIDTKDKKITYLTLLLDYVNKLLGVAIDVQPKKIVSGHEPEKTNVFLQYVAMAVGYAQQDKAKRTAEQVAGAPAPPPLRSDGATSAQAPADPAAYGMAQLPHRDSLPRKRSSTVEGQRSKSIRESDARTEATAFNKMLEGYSLNLDVSTNRGIQAESASIISMWNELADFKVTTTPSQMPPEALEKAIERQLDVLKQTRELIKQNDAVINSLEKVIT